MKGSAAAMLAALVTLFGTACSMDTGEARFEHQGEASEAQAVAREQEASDVGPVPQSEAVAQPVSPELELRLEAGYQHSLSLRKEGAHVDPVSHHEPLAVDLEALFEEIRTTMPPARGNLLRQYVAAVEVVTSAEERASLLSRLSSQELNNVR